MKKDTHDILTQVKHILLSKHTVLTYRVSPKHFTRTRKQSFANTVVFMMNFLCKSLSVELDKFFSYLSENMGVIEYKSITKSAFVQCRKKIKPEVFKYLSNSLIHEFYTDNDESLRLLYGLRVLGVDGSMISLPHVTLLEEVFGCAKNQHGTSTIQARASVLYDLLNRLVIDGSLNSRSTSEASLAFEHLKCTRNGDLIIYDRGYPSFELMYEHYQKGIHFLMRAKINFNTVTRKFHESGLTTDVVKMFPNQKINLSDKPYSKDTYIEVRLVRVVLKSGEIEILITSLIDTIKYPSSIFKDLYFLRWGVETYYDEIKNKILVEHFSGYSQYSIQQDFYAALFVSNVQSLVVNEINDELKRNDNQTKYVYKVNLNVSYGFLKNRIIELFFSKSNLDIINELKALYRVNTVPIRPGRTNVRNKNKYKRRLKPKVLKNRKDAV